MRAVVAIARKDLLVELRTEGVGAGHGPVRRDHLRDLPFRARPQPPRRRTGGRVLWVTLLFAAILGINRLFVAEREQGGFDGILMAPIERTSLLIAKSGALIVYLVALELIALPVFALFFIEEGFWQAVRGWPW